MNRTNKNLINQIKENVLKIISNNNKNNLIKDKRYGNNIYKIKETDNLIDISFSSIRKDTKRYLFGIEKEQLERIYKETRNFFQIFIIGDEKKLFIFPISFLIEIFKEVKATQHKGFSQYKISIMFRNEKWILRCFGRYDISYYLNNYSLLNLNISKIQNKSIDKKIKEISEDTKLEVQDKKHIHKIVINMLKKIGEWEGFEVLIEEKPKNFENFPYTPDCLWYKNGDLYLAIEVCNKGSVEKDKDSLKQLKHLGARKVIIVSNVDKLDRIRKLFMYNGEIKSWTEFWSFERILQMYDEGEKFFKNFEKFRKYGYNENILEYI